MAERLYYTTLQSDGNEMWRFLSVDYISLWNVTTPILRTSNMEKYMPRYAAVQWPINQKT